MKRQPFTMTDRAYKGRHRPLTTWTQIAIFAILIALVATCVALSVSDSGTSKSGPECEGSGKTSFCHVDIPGSKHGCEWLFDIDHGTITWYQECQG